MASRKFMSQEQAEDSDKADRQYLEKKREELQREMDNLISRLHSNYSRRLDDVYFNDSPLDEDKPDYTDTETWQAARQFWIDIKENLHLAPEATRKGIRKFLEFKLGERVIPYSPDTYRAWKDKLKTAVDDRSKELTLELDKYRAM